MVAIGMLVVSASCLAADRTGPVTASCMPQETIYFQCAASKGRSISLCGDAAGAVQYRFGRGKVVELAFPENAGDGAKQLLYSHYFRSQTDRYEIRFENRDVEYVLFDYQEGGRRQAGVHVTAADGSERDIACSGPVKSKLAALKGVLRCDGESALNLGRCP